MSNPLQHSINVFAQPTETDHHRLDSASDIPAPHAVITSVDDWSRPISTLDFATATPAPDIVSDSAEPPVSQESTPPPHVPLTAEMGSDAPEPVEEEVATDGQPVPQPLAEDTTPPVRLEPAAPVWEVDRFRWPALSIKLCEAEDSYFAHAGQKLHEASRQGLGILAVTSAQHGEGCTTLAICLARAVARAGARVALLDADLEHPQLANYLGLSFSNGWQNVVEGRSPWPEAAVTSLEDKITVIPAHRDQDDFDAAAVPSIPLMLRDIAAHFDLLILDLGALGRDAAQIVGSGEHCVANAAIVVRDLRQTSEADTLQAADHLRHLGVHAVGVAENFMVGQTATAAA